MERIAERLLYLLLLGSLLGCGPNAWRDWPPNVAKVRVDHVSRMGAGG